jgi:hypothetical protein
MNFQQLLWLALSQETRAAAVKIRDEDLRVRLLSQAARYTLLAQRAAEANKEKGK